MRIHGMALLVAAASLPLACAQGTQLGEDEERAITEALGDPDSDDARDDTKRAALPGESAPGSQKACSPGHGRACYTGDPATRDVGACVAGVEICLEDGSGYGPCEHEVTPVSESCANDVDDDCDGEVNQGCECFPGDTEPCYNGPPETEGVGICRSGIRTCSPEGTWFAACMGEVLPMQVEDLNTPEDDDCTGTPSDSLCEQNGILSCPTNRCAQVPSCVTAPGGTLQCVFPWRCLN
ncbi:hypothetical protein [Chondromyces crocatus]|uniref:Uncharacterized protein n=1 Tax=Chondromyces crocatus TaxID=52 RepID=A0A0K1EH74_CHOCO|nr:hypothetical protein [Chondromyces crocatus]AKT40210.1 uncharacterized protein CMC5_043630 [Chondromyces crocatus]